MSMLTMLVHLLMCLHLAHANQQKLFKKTQKFGNIWKSNMQSEIAAKSANECAIFCVKDQVINKILIDFLHK